MTKYAIRRILLLIPVLFAVYTVTFILMHATPGGPWDQEKRLPPEVIANLNKKYRLDEPLWKQYIDYPIGILTRFDFGPSFTSLSRDVTDVILDFFPVSIQLGLTAMLLGILVGVPLGIISALKQNTFADHTSMFFAIIGISTPSFVMGPLLVVVFVLTLKLLPSTGGWGRWDQIILPAITLALGPTAVLARYTRSCMLEVIRMDYIRTARAKGLAERLVVYRHALKNALIPVATVAGVILANVITGSFYVETVFAIPGIGRYFVLSVSNRDYPVLMGVTLLYAFVIAVMNLLVDLLYGFLDPRISYE